MEKIMNYSHKTFKILFNNEVIQIDYPLILQSSENKTLKSLIEIVLEKSKQNKVNKKVDDYDFFCFCGNKLELSKIIDTNICNHNILENNDFNNLKGKYLLIEKKNQDLYEEINENEKELSKEELNKIFNSRKEKKTKKIIKKNKNNDNNEDNISDSESSTSKKKPFVITEEFKKKIEEYLIKEERAQKILSYEYSLFYDENILIQLISMDIDVNKAKAALRMTRNQIADAVLIATDKQINWEDKKFLFYDNDELLDKDNLDENLIKEIKMEYPYLNENQITERLEDIFILFREHKNIREGRRDFIERNLINAIFGSNDDDDDEDDSDNNEDEE